MVRTAGCSSAKADNALASRITPGVSLPVFAINLFESLLNPLIDLRGLFAQVFEFSNMSHPRFLAWLGCGTELVLHRLSHKLTERYASLGGDRLGPAEHQVRDFEGRFHIPILPYLWDTDAGLPLDSWGSSGLLFKAKEAE